MTAAIFAFVKDGSALRWDQHIPLALHLHHHLMNHTSIPIWLLKRFDISVTVVYNAAHWQVINWHNQGNRWAERVLGN